jgi:hypothetical protein
MMPAQVLSGLISANVAALAKGKVKPMAITKKKIAIILVLGIAVVSLNGEVLLRSAQPAKGSVEPGNPKADKNSKPVLPDAKEIQRLIKQLGSDDFADREAAEEALGVVGESALDPLRSAAETSTDPEIRRRAKHLIHLTEAKLVQQARKSLLGVWQCSFTHDAPPDATKECAIIELNAKLYFINELGQITEATLEFHRDDLEATAWGALKGRIQMDKSGVRILWANKSKWTKRRPTTWKWVGCWPVHLF